MNNDSNIPQNNSQGQNDMSFITTFENKAKSLSVFIKDETSRTEKIVTALYMVTGCMSEKEPLREKLRLISLELLSDMHSLLSVRGRDSYYVLTEATEEVRSMLSFLSVARMGGLISDMNYQIIEKECLSLFSSIQSRQKENIDMFFPGTTSSPDAGVSLSRIFDEEGKTKDSSTDSTSSSDNTLSDKPLEKSQRDNPPESSSSKKSIKDTQSLKDIIKDKTKRQENIKDTIKGQLAKRKNNKTDVFNRVMKKSIRAERTRAILQVVKDKKKVSIKDISEIILDCSEKTIQRTLNELIDKGLVAKEGDKRWSTYSLSDK
ncbi:MAG: putative transcriptional regulator [Flavobacteriaceae bacterium]|jgi:predicted transcriptional regulator